MIYYFYINLSIARTNKIIFSQLGFKPDYTQESKKKNCPFGDSSENSGINATIFSLLFSSYYLCERKLNLSMLCQDETSERF